MLNGLQGKLLNKMKLFLLIMALFFHSLAFSHELNGKVAESIFRSIFQSDFESRDQCTANYCKISFACSFSHDFNQCKTGNGIILKKGVSDDLLKKLKIKNSLKCSLEPCHLKVSCTYDRTQEEKKKHFSCLYN